MDVAAAGVIGVAMKGCRNDVDVAATRAVDVAAAGVVEGCVDVLTASSYESDEVLAKEMAMKKQQDMDLISHDGVFAASLSINGAR